MVMYNEINKYMAQWLRNLIAAGLIADGVVWECSIEDIKPEDLNGFTQCHFFAGLGGWSLALRAAGVPDDYRVWSASCPCQPFSAAGAGAGFADERHLWPTVEHLARECRPARLIGEQVASRDAEPWLDLVQDDMEALGYAFGAVAFPSAGVGAPHIRDRTYWVADADSERYDREHALLRSEESGRIGARSVLEIAGSRSAGRLEHASSARGAAGLPTSAGRIERHAGIADDAGCELLGAGFGSSTGGVGDGGLADAELQQRQNGQAGIRDLNAAPGWEQGAAAVAGLRGDLRPGPTNGFWRNADWLGCRDGKWRPVEPGSFPLAHGLPVSLGHLSAGGRRLAEVAGLDAASLKRAKAYRTGVLSGAGNAINIEAARIFIECAFGSVRPAVDDLSDLI